MDKKRNIELENWLIETTGEEVMANHLGPNWNRFHEECGFYPNISMTIADQVWEHKQKAINTKHEAIESLSIAFKKIQDDCKSKQKQVDELQARLDGAYVKLEILRQIELWREDDIYELFEELEKALKGSE